MIIMKTLIKILFYKMSMKMNIDSKKILEENNKNIRDILCLLRIIKIRKTIIRIIKRNRSKMKFIYKRRKKLKCNRYIKIKWHTEFNYIHNLTHQLRLWWKRRIKKIKIIFNNNIETRMSTSNLDYSNKIHLNYLKICKHSTIKDTNKSISKMK